MQQTTLDERRGIEIIEGVLTPQRCAEIIEETERIGYRPAPITTSRGPRMAPEVRNNTRVMLDDVSRARALWAELAEVFSPLSGWDPVGLNERLRFYRYARGERFNWHRDGAYVRSPYVRSRMTLMIYLNEGFTGGQTQFADHHEAARPLSITPKTGMVLLFPHHLLHTGAVVTGGRKYVMRTDVMYAM
ncbi:MAG: prolyl 4-hydroxylase [Myxococcota bacterium]|jgi:prolyl 4-hydroxylase